MERVYAIVVAERDTARIESLLNTHGVGLNRWGRSEVFQFNDMHVVSYRIVCSKETYESITRELYKG